MAEGECSYSLSLAWASTSPDLSGCGVLVEILEEDLGAASCQGALLGIRAEEGQVVDDDEPGSLLGCFLNGIQDQRHVRWCERSENKSRRKTHYFCFPPTRFPQNHIYSMPSPLVEGNAWNTRLMRIYAEKIISTIRDQFSPSAATITAAMALIVKNDILPMCAALPLG